MTKLPVWAPSLRARGRRGHRIPVDGPTGREVARYMLDPRRLLTGRRLPYYVGIPIIWAGLRGAARLGFTLDDLLYPEYRRQEIRSPTFIFANARSGTTLLHRLLSLDDDRFVAFKLYQSLFPAVSWQRAFDKLAEVDARLGGKLVRLAEWIDARYLSGWEGIHDISLTQEEEDIAPWLYTLMSGCLTLLFPDVQRFERAMWLDRLDPASRARFMDYYEEVIRRFVYARGGDRSFLNKNIVFASHVRSVHERFPDARFIYLVRHPYEALGSMLQMWYLAWVPHSPDVPKDSAQSRAMAQLAIDYYRYGLECRSHIPSSQFHVLTFDALVADPKKAVEEIYEHFGLRFTDRYRARLDAVTREADRFKSRGHRYALEDFGLSRDEVYYQLRDVFEEFGFQR